MEMPAGQIAKAVNSLNQGEIIAYPTEAVWGLGCDPFNEKALNKLLSLKKRDQGKGLILVSSSLEHCKNLLKACLMSILKSFKKFNQAECLK